MRRPRRLLALLTSCAVVVGAAAWFARTHGDSGRSQAERACEYRLSEHQQVALEPSTDEQRTEALSIAAAEPLVQRLWGGSAPPVASDLGTPGLFIFPKAPFSNLGPLGSSTTVNRRLQSALPKGTSDWRTWTAAYRNDCEADGIRSVTIQDAAGGAGLSEVDQAYARIPVILVEVSLTRKRVFSITPNGGDPGSWRMVGQPEQLTLS